ncbi:hypothetical protein B0H17DRAFT_969390, partial [Mycena rosella]
YWSLDPSGAEHLSREEAEQLGFPIFTIEMEVGGRSWDESVYIGICQFHQAKGFDPDSQDVTRELGYPLIKILKEPDGPFVHGELTINIMLPISLDPDVSQLRRSRTSHPKSRQPQTVNLSKRDFIENLLRFISKIIQESVSNFNYDNSGPNISPNETGAPPVNNAAIIALPNHWKIIIGVQFALILTLGALWLCDGFH